MAAADGPDALITALAICPFRPGSAPSRPKRSIFVQEIVQFSREAEASRPGRSRAAGEVVDGGAPTV